MKKLRRKNTSCPLSGDRGAAMIVVLCVMALFMALALTMLFSAASITGNARITAVNKRCEIAAVSLSEALNEEITKSQEKNNDPVQTIQDYMRYNIDRAWESRTSSLWDPYIEDLEISSPQVHQVVFANLGDLEGMKTLIEENYQLQVEFYWMMDKDAPFLNNAADGDRWKLFGCHGSKMVVTCICSKGDESYKVRTVYQLNCVGVNGDKIFEEGTTNEDFNSIDNGKLVGTTWSDYRWEWRQIWTE